MTVARGGRLSQSIDLAMERLNTSVDVDRELWREDIEGSIAHARGQLEQLHATVTTGNHAARQLYRSLGFQTYGREPRGLRIGETYFDQELLVLLLR